LTVDRTLVIMKLTKCSFTYFAHIMSHTGLDIEPLH
jgi:hypothetical protein